MVHTRDEVIRVMTENYLNSLNMANLPAPDVIQENILAHVETALKTENAMRDKGDKFRYVHELLPAQIATILIRLYPIVKISSTVKGVTDYDLLAIYQESGTDAGIYVTNDAYFRKNCNLRSRGFNPRLHFCPFSNKTEVEITKCAPDSLHFVLKTHTACKRLKMPMVSAFSHLREDHVCVLGFENAYALNLGPIGFL